MRSRDVFFAISQWNLPTILILDTGMSNPETPTLTFLRRGISAPPSLIVVPDAETPTTPIPTNKVIST